MSGGDERIRALEEREWLEADGLGGFASGTASLARTRRYHGLLLAATAPPGGRTLLVADFDAFVLRDGRREAISSQAYGTDLRAPDGASRIESFASEPWPRWIFRLDDGARVVQEIFATHGAPRVVVCWRLLDAAGRPGPGTLVVRPFLAGRDYHALHFENPDHAALREPPARAGDGWLFPTYPGTPGVAMQANAGYRHAPFWYRHFHLEAERLRGFPHAEDLASPGELVFDLSRGEACWIVSAAGVEPAAGDAAGLAGSLREAERARRARFATPLDRAADAYLVRRGEGETIVAGYPWFADWGRDTFIALRGLCLARGRFDTARRILLEWAGVLSEGMLPNRFSDRGEPPEYNAVDASLWYAVCVDELLAAHERARADIDRGDRARLLAAVEEILRGYLRGTRHGIRVDADGLVAAGEPGVQLTWMDARVDGRVITPRIGKPVEVQALWWNALAGAARRDPAWKATAERAHASFAERFWNAERGMLHDVVDVDHAAGTADASFRPNQIFAVGGLPHALLEGERARAVVDACERALWTPLGLRSLAPGEPGYAPRYHGGPSERDRVYHQGTVWPWLLGAFVEAWVRVRGETPAARREARSRFVAPLYDHLEQAGVGHVSEIADGDAPHTPRGCPFQAWSVSELLRLERVVLARATADARP
jgi:predicted glycogen debranching enzyme